jgi:hypothetical protein
MEIHKFTQTGTFSIIVLTPFLIESLAIVLITGFKDLVISGVLGLVALTFLICLLIFYKTTIYIDNTSISFKLGIGLISKKYLLSDIISCKPVKNSPWYGIGIRMISGGWLYNVSGLYSVELTFKNKKSKVRIGTDKPNEIAQIINSLINSGYSESTDLSNNKKGYLLAGLVIFIILVFQTFLITYGNREPEVTATSSIITIRGMYGLTINYSDIKQLDTLSELPEIEMRTNGYVFGKILKGNFRLQNQEKAKLFVNAGNPPYILIRTNSLTIYLNYKDPKRTKNLFQTFTR